MKNYANKVMFVSLHPSHFLLLQQWLNAPHVAQWWPHDGGASQWTLADVVAKYSSYVNGYKVVDGIKKPIHAFVACIDNTPCGYIQYYNAYDFPRGYVLHDLPESLAAIDLFIGDAAYLGKGLGVVMIDAFLSQHVFPQFHACFVDPDIHNAAAIATFKKCGFKVVDQTVAPSVVWMVYSAS